ncbi:EAL domain-containing protein [Dechloromonas sp. XY25]|uniref:EAL domain-containing protein n=1 Tax=Dechloromonas hankyongensis TaxID=2908002 RepID=A0ABS9K6I3_9RHOO|nr:EAL domain-containing protein [Dechloromonas hankyongensis]MCG2578756.1 EAL domain-containing protein [Dechloromonas hankyongensis]
MDQPRARFPSQFLRSSEEILRIFDTKPSAYLILAKDFTIVAVNDAYLRATFTRREDIVGRPLFDVFPDKPQNPDAIAVRALMASLRRVLVTRAPDTMPIQKYAVHQPAEQGGGCEERYWSPVNSPVFAADGELAYIVHRVEDVTDFVRMKEHFAQAVDTQSINVQIKEFEVEMFLHAREAAKQLRESEARYRALILASSQVLYRMSPDWSEMRQLRGGDFITDTEEPNRNWLHEYIHPDGQPRVQEAIKGALQTGTVFEFEHQVRRVDGSLGWTSSRAVPVRNADGEIIEWFGAAEDISARKEAEQRLRESEEKYRTLFANMAEAFALGEMIHDEHGIPVDFVWLEANEAFYRETGLPCSIVGRQAKEFLPRLEWHWLGAFDSVAKTGRSVHLEDSNADTQRFYDVTCFRPTPGRFAIVFRDVTEVRRTRDALLDSERRLALALIAGDSAVWEMEVASGIIKGEDKLYTMAGYAPGELKSIEDWFAIVHPEDAAGLPERIAAVVAGNGDKCSFEARIRTKSGDWRWNFSQAVVAGRDADGRALRLIGTHTDITERKLAELRIRHAALHDPLTDLPNRALVFEYGSRLLAGIQRKHMHGALLFIDLDRFKPINDIYGHNVGDQVLQEVGKRLVACTRNEDLVGRLGGDEFVILLPNLDINRRRAAVVAQNVLDRIGQPFRIDPLELSLSPSIGISYYPEHASDVGALIHAADLAMYQAKQSGRAGYRFYNPDLDRRADEAYTIEARLKHVLKHGRLALHYQPVVDIGSGQLIGAEALVRIADNGGAPPGPATFIPIAEAAGLIGEIGDWVLREACRQHDAWLAEGLCVAIAINVSPLQFRQHDFAEKLGSILTDSGVDPTGLQLEITESTVMESIDEAIAILGRIKALGIKVALDDFGTGYSSLSRLSSLPLDKLKVDQSFVRNIESDQASRAVTEAIIALGRSLKLDVIGEGIESKDTLQYLQEHGCTQAQGYLFSQPLPASQFVQWHRQQHMH